MRSLLTVPIFLLILALSTSTPPRADDDPGDPALDADTAIIKCGRLVGGLSIARDSLICRIESDARWAAMDALRVLPGQGANAEELARLQAAFHAAMEQESACEKRVLEICMKILTSRTGS